MYEIILKEDESKIYYVENPCFCKKQSTGEYCLVDFSSANCLYLQETGTYYFIEGRFPIEQGLPSVFVGVMTEQEVMSYKELTEATNSNSTNIQTNSDAIDDIIIAITPTEASK